MDTIQPWPEDPAAKREFHQLITADEVAWYLSVTRARVYELAREGLIPTVRVGRTVRFCPDAIVAWAENGGAAHPGGWKKEA